MLDLSSEMATRLQQNDGDYRQWYGALDSVGTAQTEWSAHRQTRGGKEIVLGLWLVRKLVCVVGVLLSFKLLPVP